MGIRRKLSKKIRERMDHARCLGRDSEVAWHKAPWVRGHILAQERQDIIPYTISVERDDRRRFALLLNKPNQPVERTEFRRLLRVDRSKTSWRPPRPNLERVSHRGMSPIAGCLPAWRKRLENHWVALSALCGTIHLRGFQRLIEADFLNDFRANSIGAGLAVQASLPSQEKYGRRVSGASLQRCSSARLFTSCLDEHGEGSCGWADPLTRG